jgi:glucose/mannose-6-phosphate isomerase
VAELDDLDAIERLDSLNVLDAVERFADQCREGWDIGRAATGLPDGAGVESVVVLGMGGSGVSGDVVGAIVEPRLAVPLRTIKGYGPLPEWIGRNTLVFAVSYSGNTEETLAAVEEAHARGTRTVTISSGGELQERARQWGVAHVQVPGGLQPRASLGYLTLPVLAVLVAVGLLPDVSDDVDEAVGLLTDLGERLHRSRDVADNSAKSLAARITGKIPVVYGGEGLGAVVAQRFKNDLNEYGKTPAFSNVLPELDHNEIVGWNRLADVTSQHFVAVLVRDEEEHERVAIRFELTKELITDKLADVIEVHSEGPSRIARVLSLLFVTQLAAIYTAVTYDIDPGPVEVIESLKARLAER